MSWAKNEFKFLCELRRLVFAWTVTIAVYVCVYVVLLIFIIAFADCATSLNVRFTFRTYIVVEGDVFRPELILSESSSTDITVQVIADDITTTGE